MSQSVDSDSDSVLSPAFVNKTLNLSENHIDIPLELVQQIVYEYRSNLQSLRALRLVSRAWYSAATPHLFATAKINRRRELERWHKLHTLNPDLFKEVKGLTVQWDNDYEWREDTETESLLASLASIISAMSNIKFLLLSLPEEVMYSSNRLVAGMKSLDRALCQLAPLAQLALYPPAFRNLGHVATVLRATRPSQLIIDAEIELWRLVTFNFSKSAPDFGPEEVDLSGCLSLTHRARCESSTSEMLFRFLKHPLTKRPVLSTLTIDSTSSLTQEHIVELLRLFSSSLTYVEIPVWYSSFEIAMPTLPSLECLTLGILNQDETYEWCRDFLLNSPIFPSLSELRIRFFVNEFDHQDDWFREDGPWSRYQLVSMIRVKAPQLQRITGIYISEERLVLSDALSSETDDVYDLVYDDPDTELERALSSHLMTELAKSDDRNMQVRILQEHMTERELVDRGLLDDHHNHYDDYYDDYLEHLEYDNPWWDRDRESIEYEYDSEYEYNSEY